jgi:NhaP-type Na+/H+ or K+/H+ antiporter
VFENPLIGLVSIIVLGMFAQWLAWRLRLPSILLLLLSGFVVGPVTGLLDPTALLGDLLFPVVSLSVAIILFEGGLSLNIGELREVGKVVRRLISLGVFVTWVLGAVAARLLLNLDWSLSLLLGAILTVSGPTVVLPLLRHVRPTARVTSTLKWEGILIDPVGATLAVLVFEAIIVGEGVGALPQAIAIGILKTVLVGGVTGVLGAIALYFPIRRYWIPDTLQNPMSLMMVVLWFVIANTLQDESGLLTVTVMGILLANQRQINIRNIIKFKENLVMLLLSAVFIILAARLQLSDLSQLGLGSVVFIAVLILVIRPLAVLASTIGSELNWRERTFVAALAPRGIVAAAVSAVFALELAHNGHPQASELVPITFLVIVSTVSVYSLAASFIANRLGIAQAEPQGVLFVGAHPWARQIALALQAAGGRVLLVDSNFDNTQEARMLGLPAHFGSILGEDTINELDLNGIGRIIAMTSNDEVNALADMHFTEVFDSAETYQLAPRHKDISDRNDISRELHGRFAFGRDITFTRLQDVFEYGAEVRATPLTAQFTYKDFRTRYGDRAITLFLVSKDGHIDIFAADTAPEPLAGQTIISIITPDIVELDQGSVENQA